MTIESEFLPAESTEFFAPASYTAIDLLIDQYKHQRKTIEEIAIFAGGDRVMSAFGYFFRGAKEKFNRYTPEPSSIFNLEVALPALNADFWNRALQMTDVMDFMPDKRRWEWRESIEKMTVPEFEESAVKATLADLLNKRMDFLVEMVDGIFKGLSAEHLTNQPEGFSKRMIINNVYGSWGYQDKKAGLIHDMRGIISKFMGRGNPKYGVTRDMLDRVRNDTGVWHNVDGGAFRIRVYKKGTAHLEVHPQIAYRLNQILAHLYPMAIPSQFRQKPKSKARTEFNLIQRPLPFEILEMLSNTRFWNKGEILVRKRYDQEEIRADENTLTFDWSVWKDADKHLKTEMTRVMEAIGGVRGKNGSDFIFEYDPSEVLRHIRVSGLLPDNKSHQFYPTPEKLAIRAVELADIDDVHTCLEPSAGQGGLAEYMPTARTKCVEISSLNCSVLKAKGFNVVNEDFLGLCGITNRFDRIVMNPPFSEGRWKSHLEVAVKLLADGGRLVAILPSSAKNKDLLPGLSLQWHGPFENEFAGTSISVCILIVDKL